MEPLAERMRPASLDDIFGQGLWVGGGKLFSGRIAKNRPTSLILWGPPGSGKTTLARIIARETGADFVELSAVTSGKADVVKVIEYAKTNQRLAMQTVLFVDEIHRFNKAQQDAFLPHVENGTLILIGATTENPSFEVIGPLLSRCRVLVLEQLDEKELGQIIKRAADFLNISLDKDAFEFLIEASNGDARVMLNVLEIE